MGNVLLVKPLDGGAVTGSAIEDLDADFVASFAVNRK